MAIDYFAQQFSEDKGEAKPDYRQMVLDAYATIGRTGIGTEANQVDIEGADAFTEALETGKIKPEDWNARFQTEVKDYIAANPDDKYSQYVSNYLGNKAADTNTGGISDLITTGATTAAADTTSGINSLLDTNTSTAANTPDYRQMVIDAYGSIGRTGIGTEASNIDQRGLEEWVKSLQRGDSTPEAFNRNFQTAVVDYLANNPEDKYSTYVADYLTRTKPAAFSGVVDLYQDVLGRAPDPKGLANWYKQVGADVSSEDEALFKTAAKTELDSRIQDLYSEFMGSGRIAEEEAKKYWGGIFGNKIDASKKEQFRQAAAAELSGAFGANGINTLAGFKYAKDLGISDAGLKTTLGEALYNKYKDQLKTTTTTSINDIIADNSATFEELQKVSSLARDLGYNSQQLADLTGKDKSLFDTLLTSYDTNRNKIINDTLAGPNVLTDADRVIASYALEKQFGFTDDEIAKATGVDVKVVQDSLNPVRNFETDFSKIANNTDSTTQQLKDFVNNAKSNAAIDKLYGEALTGYENKIAELETKWSRYGSDAIQSENLFQQLNAQRNALGGQYFQGVFGDLENSTALLVKKGLDTLGDLGQKDKFITASVYEDLTTADGRRVFKEDNEYLVPITDSEGIHTGKFEKVDSSKIVKKYFKNEDDGYGNSVVVPLSEQELKTLKDGKYQQKIGSVVIDKDTGAELTDTTGQLAFQKSGGHFTGKNNWLNVKFTKDGTPYLTATTEKTGINAFVSEMGPMVISIAAMIPGPHQPFAQMANAAMALEQKNYLGAVLSGLNAAGSFTGTELSTLKTAEAAGDIINTSRVLDLQSTLSDIKLAQTAVSGLAALQADNIAGVINSSLSAYGQINGTGGKLPSGLTTIFQAGSLVNALNSNNISAALVSLGDLTGSKDLRVAASATNLIDALQSGNQANIIKAGLVFSNAFQAANNTSTTNIGALNDLTTSGRTGDDMGGSYDVIDGLNAAGLTQGETDINSIIANNSPKGIGSDLVATLAEEPDNQGSGMFDSDIPSWVVTAKGESVTGSRVDSEGRSRYTITRENPNDPDQPVIYEAVLDPETGEVSYEWGGPSFDEEGNVAGNVTTISSGSKPSWTFLTEDSVSSTDDESKSTDSTSDALIDALLGGSKGGGSSNVDSLIDSIVKDGAGGGTKGDGAGTGGKGTGGSGSGTDGTGSGTSGTGAGSGTGGTGTGSGTGGTGTGGDSTGGDGTDGDDTVDTVDTVDAVVTDDKDDDTKLVCPEGFTLSADGKSCVPITKQPPPPPPVVKKPVVKKPVSPEYSVRPGSEITMPSQDPYAKIKLMEELFGTDIAYKLLGIDEKAGKSLGAGDLNALLKLLGSK